MIKDGQAISCGRAATADVPLGLSSLCPTLGESLQRRGRPRRTLLNSLLLLRLKYKGLWARFCAGLRKSKAIGIAIDASVSS
jgi:hypothetical protein